MIDLDALGSGYDLDFETASKLAKQKSQLKEKLKGAKDPSYKPKKPKKKKKAAGLQIQTQVVKHEPSAAQITRMQLYKNKLIALDNGRTRVSHMENNRNIRGFFNRKNNCFLNVILQSMMSVPLFFNYLAAFAKDCEADSELAAELEKGDHDVLVQCLHIQKELDPSRVKSDLPLDYLNHPERIFKNFLPLFTAGDHQ